ncbi:MAG: hypothetical protein K6T33_06145 [Thermomonas hydrothermalis]|uniref:hypothetical protein n=1 Tax=Thermomonas hydrothermalis TaxID=213588 RepID=UPI002354D259|nr:hypothetical protein [Thermomonas hydrothermalis]MCL6619354.1 hypothetical protein [Thermomonas hydrothermalis]
MDKSQAEAVAQAILDPDVKSQEEVCRKRAAADRRLAERHKVVWFLLVGGALGAAVAYFSGHSFTKGMVWGGVAAAFVRWVFVTWGRYRSVP